MKPFAWLSLLVLAGTLQAAPVKQPNIVFILTDDQGYGDISAHGNPTLKTPNLDRLHAEGVRFTASAISPAAATASTTAERVPTSTRFRLTHF